MNVLAVFSTPGWIEPFAVALIFVLWTVLPILVVIWFARKVLENKRENVRLRLEVGKLADELEQVRKQQKADG